MSLGSENPHVPCTCKDCEPPKYISREYEHLKKDELIEKISEINDYLEYMSERTLFTKFELRQIEYYNEDLIELNKELEIRGKNV